VGQYPLVWRVARPPPSLTSVFARIPPMGRTVIAAMRPPNDREAIEGAKRPGEPLAR